MLHSQDKLQKVSENLAELEAMAPVDEPSRLLGTAAGVVVSGIAMVGSTGIASAHEAEAPRQEFVTIESGGSLSKLAKAQGLSLDNLLADPENEEFTANPELVHPGDMVHIAPDVSGGEYVIQPGDNLSAISKLTGVPTAALQQANGIANPDKIKAGELLIIPQANQSDVGISTDRIRAGESLTVVAKRLGVPLPELITMNPQFSANGRDISLVYPGEEIIIKADSPRQTVTEHVDAGETLNQLAEKYGVSLDSIRALNPQIVNPHLILAGSDLLITSPERPVEAPELSVAASVAEVVTPPSVEIAAVPPRPELTDVEGLKVFLWHGLTVEKGMNPVMAAGLMGNIQAEANFAPGRIQGRPVEVVGDHPRPNVGFGICQWTSPGRQQGLIAMANERKVSPNDPQLQIDYLMVELEGPYLEAYAALQAAKTPEEASDIVMTQFEKPRNQRESAKEMRREFARDILNEMPVRLKAVQTPEPSSEAVEAPALAPVTELNVLPDITPVPEAAPAEAVTAPPLESNPAPQPEAPATTVEQPVTPPVPESTPAPAEPQHSVAGETFVHPVGEQYPISSDFGPRQAPRTNHGHGSSQHNGTDYATPVGTNVVAPQDGVVVFAGEKGPNGNLVVIDHGPNSAGQAVTTAVAHLDSVAVHEGDHVAQGQEIAESGNSGNSSGPHAHVTVRVGGEPVDPEPILNGDQSL